MDNTPRVSVLMTAYNREPYIAEAIESVLASTFQDFELIIVDDCSKDNTLRIARSYEAKDQRVKVYANEKNLGDYPNRNKAASYAKGKYLKYLDSDDLIYQHGLEIMVKSIEKFPEAGFGILSRADYVSPYPKMLSSREIYLEHFEGYGHLNRAPGSLIIKRAVFEALGGFSGKNLIGDSEMWFKMARSYPVVKINEDLYWPRSHPDQVQNTVTVKEYDRLREIVVEDALTHVDCPLTQEDVAKIRTLIRKNKKKVRVFTMLSKLSRILG